MAGAVLLGFAAASWLTLSRDAAWLYAALRTEQPEEWSTKFQGDAGPVLLGALRLGLRYHESLEPEILTGLAAVRRVSVGVYRLRSNEADDGALLAFPAARTGWIRLATVQDDRDAVVVYVREPATGAKTVSVALAVREPGQVVVLAGEIEPGHLLALIPVRS